MQKENFKIFLKIVLVLTFVYLFLVSIGLMGAAFKGFGKAFAENLIKSTSNPFIGLFIGILATSIVQSSSTTTSIVVGMVGYNILTVGNAIPIIMGANIGTTVTSTLVALGHVTRREEFRRAIAGATLHDFFKVMCVCIMLPLELTTGFLEKIAHKMAILFSDFGGIKFTSPVKFATEPVINFIESWIVKLNLTQSQYIIGIMLLIVSLAILFFSLYYIVKLMKALVIGRVEIVLNNVIGKHGVLAMAAALVFTAIIQSSSVTTSLMVPLVASGIFTVESIYPIIMGANIGTTVTAMLASFATGNISAISVAFVHFLFNVIAVVFIYPIKIMREIPLRLAKGLGNLAYNKRHYAILFVAGMFFIIPGLMVFISRFFK